MRAKLVRRGVRRRRPHGRHRGGPDRPGAVGASRSATARAPSPSPRRRTSSGSATATPGPNTGGMGAYSPAAVARRRLRRRRDRRGSSQPTLAALRRRGIDYRGVLYAGLMLTPDGPEAARVQRPLRRPGQPGRAACGSRSDLAALLAAAAAGALAGDADLRRRRRRHSSCRAAEGYPAAARTGDADRGPRRRRGRSTASTVFCAGVADGARTAASSPPAAGCSTSSAAAPTSPTARARAYAGVGHLRWPGLPPPHRHRQTRMLTRERTRSPS